jgi:ComF family protein
MTPLRHAYAQFLEAGQAYLTGLVQLIYPNTCWVCSRLMPADALHVCAACAKQLLHDPHPTCPRCSSSVGPYSTVADGCPACRTQPFAFDGAVRLGPYNGLLRDVVLRMKHPSGEELAEVVGSLWARHAAARLRALRSDVIVPIPLHWTRRWQRGFNQSEVLARCLGSELRIPCALACLRRVRQTPRQSEQPSAAARRANVQAAFAVRPDPAVRDKTILLVDDVLTTGATASAAARSLRSLQPRQINVAVLAHGA